MTSEEKIRHERRKTLDTQPDLVGGPSSGAGQASMTPSQKVYMKYSRIYQTQLDRTVIFPQARWIFFAVLLAFYCIRVYYIEGFYIVSYAAGIYLLHLVIGFLSPAIDPEDDVDGGPMLPREGGEEFRPFSRKLPEFKFWHAATKAMLIFTTMTFFRMFDLPVFWPILLAYFLLLCFVTMKERVKHMIKYKYVPFSWGKQTYKDLTRVDLNAQQVTPPRQNQD